MTFLKKNIPGILMCAIIAGMATTLATLKIGDFSVELIGEPMLAILMGMIISLAAPNITKYEKIAGGIKFTSKKILQWAVIILGFTLDLGMIARVGAKSLPVIVCTISISLIVSFLLMKLLKIDPKTACLIGVGSSICGGSAIAATAPVTFSGGNCKADAYPCNNPYNPCACIPPCAKGKDLRRIRVFFQIGSKIQLIK